MNKILIVNLKRFGDIYQSAHLINSLAKNHPGTEIHMLVYKDFKKAARSLTNVTSVLTINKKKIESFYKNELYSNGLAINELNETMLSLCKEEWTDVINYSNDKASTFISTYIANETDSKIHGVYFNSTNSVSYSNNWACFLNEVLSVKDFSPLSYNEVFHRILNLRSIDHGDKIKSNSQHNETAKQNFLKLKETLNSENPSKVKIVGIQLLTSQEDKNIPFQTITDFIRYAKASNEICPILLVAPSEKEKAFANRINAEFDNTLVSVECDLIALPSVVANLDAIVTPDTLIKHVSDLLSTPVIEVSLGPSPTFKQGSNNLNSLILREKKSNIGEAISAKDIYQSTLLLLNKISSEDFDLSNNTQCYFNDQDEFGNYIVPLNKTFDFNEATRLMSRAYLSELEKNNDKEKIFKNLKNSFDQTQLNLWLEREKVEVSECTKLLLRALRSLIRTQENLKNAPQFVNDLDGLLGFTSSNSLSGMTVLYFRGIIDSLENDNTEENLKGIERAVYQLKNDLQTSLHIIRDFEKFYRESKGADITKRLQKNLGGKNV
tara:strand:- start:202126 stop:203778 length:1653 start_codon:yes stop_codon:yes gene_type:complete